MWYFLKGRRSTKNAFKTINTRKFFFFYQFVHDCGASTRNTRISNYIMTRNTKDCFVCALAKLILIINQTQMHKLSLLVI